MPDAQVHSGAMIGFKTGLQSAVNTMLANGTGAVHGTFYLATDTHRLYIGNENGSLSPVNEGVVTVSNVNALNTEVAPAGSFYYASNENILCVYNGSEWVQINSDTDTSINTFSSSANANGKVTLTLSEKNKAGTQVRDNINAEFTVTGSNGITITGSGTGDSTALNIAGNTYTLGHKVTGNGADGVATINLTSANPSSAASSSLDIVAGNNVEITEGTNGGIKVSAVDTINSISDVAVTAEASGFKVTVSESKGSSDFATINPTITYGEADAQTGNKSSANFVNGVADLSVYTKSQIDAKMQALDAMHYRGTIGQATPDPTDPSKTIGVNGSAAQTSTIDPSTFKLNPPLKVGDTFKLSSLVTINGDDYSANSIIIARGNEDSNGNIQQNSLQFDVIQATVNEDTTYVFRSNIDATNDNAVGILLHSSTGGDNSSFRIKPGTAITVTGSGTESNSHQVVTVAHANMTGNPQVTAEEAVTQNAYNFVNDTAVTDTTVPVVTSVTVDAQGHTTEVETTNIVLKDTNARLTNLTTTAAAHQESGVDVPNKIDITTTAAIQNGGGSSYNKADTVSISSDNLSITKLADANEIKINLVWGSFGPQQ